MMPLPDGCTMAESATNSATIRQERELLPDPGYAHCVHLSAEDLLVRPPLGQDLAERIDNRGIPHIREVSDAPDPVHPDDIGLVLDGARPQQGPPVLAPCVRPVG